MNRRPKRSPEDKILDAAERAFAESGFEGASLRQIVQDARVNLATVYYYFESKQGLLAAVLDRRFRPLREEMLEMLRQNEEKAHGGPVPLEQILEGMLSPPLRMAAGNCPRHQQIVRLMGRMVNEPNPATQKLLRGRHHEIREAYMAALRRTLPHLQESDLQWRFEFVWGALAAVLCNPRKIEIMTGGICNPAETATVLNQFIQCFCAGFTAPAAP